MNEVFSMQELIREFLEKNNKSRLYHERNIIQIWNEKMGPFIKNNTQNIEIKNRVLYVHILNAALRFELMGRKSDIVKKLNDEVGIEIIRDIIIH